MIAVILSGGSGTRFWPKSRELYPKQFLCIAGPRTMIQDTAERILPLIPIEKIFVVTNELYAFETCKQLAEYGFNPANLLAEPAAKNTAPALGFAARILAEDYADEVMAVFPADHVVKNPATFHQVLRTAETVAIKDYLVTLAIQPSRPETGYGYIKKGATLDNGSFRVKEFVEKPDSQTAQKFLDDGGYFWNCGIFLWKISVLLDEIKNLMPELYKNLCTFTSQTQTGKYAYRTLNAQDRKTYQELQSISIDYGILEKSGNVAVVPTQMPWSDVGSWAALEEISPTDQDGNLLTKNVIALDCTGSTIQGEERLIAIVGAKDLVVVDTPDALLVCDKARTQDVKKIVEKIKSSGRPEAKSHTKTHEPWGSRTVLEKNATHAVVRLEILPGETFSNNAHRDKTWVIIDGQAEVSKNGEMGTLDKNQTTFIAKNTQYQLTNHGGTTLAILEIQTGDDLGESI